MKKYLLSLIILLSAWGAQAHHADISSTMLVEQADNSWIVNIRTALTAFEHEIKTKNLETPYKTAEEFQELVLQHIKENLHIYFNEEDEVILKNGRVKLGHESNVIFEMEGVPTIINSVFVKNTSFKTIHRNQSALIVLKKGFDKEQFTLNKKNNHTMHLKVANNKLIPFNIEVVTAAINPNNTNYIFGITAFAFLGIFGFLWKKRTSQTTTS